MRYLTRINHRVFLQKLLNKHFSGYRYPIPPDSMTSPYILYEESMSTPWKLHEFTMGLLWVLHEFTMSSPWVYHENTCKTHGKPMGYSWDTLVAPPWYPCKSHEKFMNSPGIPLRYPLDTSRIPPPVARQSFSNPYCTAGWNIGGDIL